MQNRLKTLILGLLTVLFLATACQPQSQEEMEDAGEDISQAVEMERKALKEDLQEASRKIDQELAQLETKIDEASGETRQKLIEQRAELKKQSEKLDQQLAQLDQNIEEGWDSFKAEVNQTVNAVEESIEEPAPERKN